MFRRGMTGILAALCAGLLGTMPLAAEEAAIDRILGELAKNPSDTSLLEMLKASLLQMPDGEQQGRYLVIYALGCYYVGDEAKAESVKVYAIRKCPTCPELKYLTTRYTKERCPTCNGRGTRSQPCPACHGNGRCEGCGGRGYILMTGINDTKKKVACHKCKGKGVCAVCDGKGKSEEACPDCRGEGVRVARAKIKSIYLALLKRESVDDGSFGAPAPLESAPAAGPAPAVARAEPPPHEHHWITRDRPGDSGASIDGNDAKNQMSQYVHAMEQLDAMEAKGESEYVSLTEVRALPERYVGKLLRSRAYLISSFPREVVVATRSTAEKEEGTKFLPRTVELGIKATDLFKQYGKGKRVEVTYGVISTENMTLFELTPL